MEIFFTADLHLNHPDILWHCNRPWLQPGDRKRGKWTDQGLEEKRVDEMNEAIVSRWNSMVSRKDRVYIIGDFAFSQHGKWVNELNGQLILIAGNHDDMPVKYKEQFTEYHEFGVDKILRRQRLVMCHYPLRTWDHKRDGAWHLHGHVHGRMKMSLPGAKNTHGGLMLDVGMDIWDFYPVPFDTVKQEMHVKQQAIGNKSRKNRR